MNMKKNPANSKNQTNMKTTMIPKTTSLTLALLLLVYDRRLLVDDDDASSLFSLARLFSLLASHPLSLVTSK